MTKDNISPEDFDQEQILDNIGRELDFIKELKKQLYENSSYTDEIRELITKRNGEIKKMYLMYEPIFQSSFK